MNHLILITWEYRKISINTNKSHNFITIGEKTEFTIIPESGLENSLQEYNYE